MELGKFIAKVTSEVKENVKGDDCIEGGIIELNLIICPNANNDKIDIQHPTDSQNVCRIKIPLCITMHDWISLY